MDRGHFYARLEDQDWTFLSKLGEAPPFDAAIVKASYLAPYPDGDSRFEQPPARLTTALTEREWHWALDPATAAHGHPNADEWTSSRAMNCSLASAAPMPWKPDDLSNPHVSAELIDRAVELQIASQAVAAPYLEVADANDPRVDVNCSLISAVAERAADQRAIAYLQILSRHLLDGSALTIAKSYVAAGAQSVFIRIRRLDPLDFDHLLAYLGLIESIEDAGAHAVADSTGRFGPTLVAGGAYAFSAGARCFHKVSDALLQRAREGHQKDQEQEKKSGGGPPLLYELPGQLTGLRRDAAGAHLAPCYEPSCRAENGLGNGWYVREHNLHEFNRLAHQAAAEGPAFAQTLRAIGTPETLLWASALEHHAAQRRAA